MPNTRPAATTPPTAYAGGAGPVRSFSTTSYVAAAADDGALLVATNAATSVVNVTAGLFRVGAVLAVMTTTAKVVGFSFGGGDLVDPGGGNELRSSATGGSVVRIQKYTSNRWVVLPSKNDTAPFFI